MNTAAHARGGRLCCRNLRKVFRRTVVLDDVSFEVEPGRALVLLGSSGAGKTTLLRILAGLEDADGGTVTLDEQVLSDPEVRVAPEDRGVGVVFQALELWPQMTVAEHVAFGLPGRPHGRAARKNAVVRSLAEEVGLDDALLRRRPATLSGGEQQRVAIARTLAARPGVLLYDEPLANLDPDRRRSLRALIRRLAHQHGTTLVYVTHDPEEALEIGDEVVVLASGRVVERGPPQALYRGPTTLAGAQALGPVTVVAAGWRDGMLDTPFGVLEALPDRQTARSGPCLVLLRPESICVDAGGRAEVRVDDVVARGTDWAFTGILDGRRLHGRSSEALVVGETVRVRAEGPAAVIADTSSADTSIADTSSADTSSADASGAGEEERVASGAPGGSR